MGLRKEYYENRLADQKLLLKLVNEIQGLEKRIKKLEKSK